MSTPASAGDPAAAVAHSADAAELHAPVPTLLLELQTLLGTLAATVAAETNRGRRPFRPAPEWSARVGELGYGVYLLADQTGVDLARAVGDTAARVGGAARPEPVSAPANRAQATTDFFDRP